MAAESVKVLVVNAIGDESLRMIRSLSPRIEVTDASDLARAERRGDFSRRGELDVLLASAEVIYALKFPPDLIARAPRLNWVQMYSTGVDRALDDDFRNSRVTMTCMSGCHETTIGEFVLMLMLMFVKQAPRSFLQKQSGRWKWFPVGVLRSKTVGIVGLGRIGRELARVCQAFGMGVLATHRSARKVTRARNVDRVLPREQLPELLSQSDFVVIAVPLTSETRGLIGEKELRAMKPTAYLINIARGAIVDEAALIRALREQWIAGAGLDVFATEPLPPDSPLREFPNVIFSPHVAGDIEDYNARATELFCENLRRYLDGRKLLNVVDKKRGY